MTELAQELLEDVCVGDLVRVTYGSDDDKSEGVIRKITDNFITLEGPDGLKAKIKVDLLTAVVMLSVAGKGPEPEQTPTPEKPVAVETVPVPNVRVFRELPEHVPCACDSEYWLEELRKMQRGDISRPMAAGVDGVLSSFRDARKTNSLASKYHTLRMKTLNLWDKCDLSADYRCFYLLLGLLAVEAEDYFNAYEPLVRAREYALAACAAARAEDPGKEIAFLLCALLNRDPQVQVDRFLADACVRRTDVSILSALLEVYQQDPETCEAIAACADHAYRSLGPTAAPMEFAADCDPVTAANTLIKAMPQAWQIQSQLLRAYEEYNGYLYPAPQNPQDGADYYTGIIEKYDIAGKWGRIRIHPDCQAPVTAPLYFQLQQVPCETPEDVLLRRMLMEDRGEGLEVSFYIGMSRQPKRVGNPAATDLMLTDAGLDEAERRLTAPKDGTMVGYIEEESFNIRKGVGVIRAGGKKFSFNAAAVIDPRLKAYYENCFQPMDQTVSFHVVRVGASKLHALDICWENPREKDLETYCTELSAQTLEQWESLRRERDLELAGVRDRGSVYTQEPFVDLEDWVPVNKRTAKPLTWPAQVRPTVKKEEPEPAPVPVPEKQEKTEKPAAKAEETVLGKAYADTGRKAMMKNRLEDAEAAMLQALAQGANPDSVVGDLVTIYLRQPEKLNRAVELLDKYESKLSREKVLNLRVSTYDKLKDHSVLCGLYEEVFRLTTSVSRKSHALIRLAYSLTVLKRYDEALVICQRWERLFQQNRYSADAVKLRGAKPSIERQKAVCYYHTGRQEEARQIAMELVRNNPADTAANAILDGTLTASESGQDEGTLGNMDELMQEGATEDHSTQMPRLVQDQIQATDVSEVLKTKHIRDKRYIGTVAQANADINTLSAKTGNTPRSRSMNHFAICKIMGDVESREKKSFWKGQQVRRLAGRGMASLGDYLLSISSQMDSARMAYLYAIQMLPPEMGVEQDMANAYNRLIKSYFMGREKLSVYIDQQNISHSKDGINTDVFVTDSLAEVLVPEFFVGILQLLSALDGQPKYRRQLIDDLYNRNRDLRKQVIRQMSEFLGDAADDDSLNAASFAERLDQSVRGLKLQITVLAQALRDVTNQLMGKPLEEDDLTAIGRDDWHRNLCATDFKRLQMLHKLLRRTQDYHFDLDFENRTDCLRAVLSEAKDLMESIQKEPTALSYDVYLPVLDTIVEKISDCQDVLYQEYQPRLSWRESIQPFKTREGLVQVQLMVKNEQNCQTADMLRVEAVLDGDVLQSWGSSPLNNLRGGEEREILMTLDITGEAKQAGSFCAALKYTYRRSKADHSVEQMSGEQTFTLVLRSEDFVPLKNPYKDHIGNRMDDVNMFYGRSQQIDQMVEMLCPRSTGKMNYGRAIAMYGQTRTGKSSLLYHFQKRLEEQYGQRVVVWDMGNIGNLNAEQSVEYYLPTFLYRMLDIGSAALEDHEVLCDCVEDADLMPPLTEILREPQFATLHFMSYMSRLNRILKEQQCIIVLFVDEFTYLHGLIRKGRLSEDFMKFWKAFLQDYCVFAVIAGQDDTPEFIREYPNEFACMETMKVTYLDEISAKLLIREPLERDNGGRRIFLNNDPVDELYRLTAGSAYLTILLCSHLVNYLNEKGASTVTRGIVADFLEKKAFGPMSFLEENNFEPQIRERGHEELDYVNKRLLHSIARMSQANGRADISKLSCTDEQGVALDQEQIQRLVDRLVDRNVLVSAANGYCWIQVKLLEQWLINTMGEE